MSYNPDIPRDRYDNYGDREWTRLERDGHGLLLYAVHMDVLRERVGAADRVLEIGAGSGRFTKELVNMCGELTVADISSRQIEFNMKKMEELQLFNRIKAFHILDVLRMDVFSDEAFDCVVCVGGVVNYLLDRERDGVCEMLRVLKPGGILIVGSMGFIGSAMFYLDAIRQEKNQFGMEATRWIFETGLQDGEHYPSLKKHYVHMMRSAQLDALFAGFPAEVIERRSAGLFSLAGDEAVEAARQDAEFWELILDKEIAFSKLPGTLDCGMNLIYVVRKTGYSGRQEDSSAS